MNLKMLRIAFAAFILCATKIANAGIVYDESIDGDDSAHSYYGHELTLSGGVNQILGSTYTRYSSDRFDDSDSYDLFLQDDIIFSSIDYEITARDVTDTLFAGDWFFVSSFYIYSSNCYFPKYVRHEIDSVSQTTTGPLSIDDPTINRIRFTRRGWTLNPNHCFGICEATLDWKITINTISAEVPEPSTFTIFALTFIGLALGKLKND